jgi:hypothetical protein
MIIKNRLVFVKIKKNIWRRFNYIEWKLGNSMKTSFKISLIFIEIAAKFSPDIFILFKKIFSSDISQ